MSAPFCIDLYAGLGGWTEGFLAEGFDVIGFDIERHVYGEHRYPAQLVLQDVRTLHGSQFRDATIIVASSPCQEFSYRAMPWKRAKALGPPELGMELFAQAARIQREACEAAGRYIPMIQENVPALMPITARGRKVSSAYAGNGSWKSVDGDDWRSPKNTGGEEFEDGIKQGGDWFNAASLDGDGLQSISRRSGSKSKARKAASARIAKIPFPLAQYIAQITRAAQERAA
jgi:hypothetical protein